jgi:hypothetical protein
MLGSEGARRYPGRRFRKERAMPRCTAAGHASYPGTQRRPGLEQRNQRRGVGGFDPELRRDRLASRVCVQVGLRPREHRRHLARTCDADGHRPWPQVYGAGTCDADGHRPWPQVYGAGTIESSVDHGRCPAAETSRPRSRDEHSEFSEPGRHVELMSRTMTRRVAQRAPGMLDGTAGSHDQVDNRRCGTAVPSQAPRMERPLHRRRLCEILGVTAIGRATVTALSMNRVLAVAIRYEERTRDRWP